MARPLICFFGSLALLSGCIGSQISDAPSQAPDAIEQQPEEDAAQPPAADAGRQPEPDVSQPMAADAGQQPAQDAATPMAADAGPSHEPSPTETAPPNVSALRLKTPWHDGTTHLLFEPLDFVAKLAALVPRPRKNLVLYHGVLAANAAWRSRVVSHGREPNAFAPQAETTPTLQDELCVQEHGSASGISRTMRRQWAELMHRAFGYDMSARTHCGG